MKFLSRKVLIILLRLSCTTAELSGLKFNNVIHKLQESASNCILQVARKFFPISSNICFVTQEFSNLTYTNKMIAKTSDRIILEKLFYEHKWTVSTFIAESVSETEEKDVNNIKRVRNKVDSYLIFLKSKAEFLTTMNNLSKASSWNPHALVLLYIGKLLTFLI